MDFKPYHRCQLSRTTKSASDETVNDVAALIIADLNALPARRQLNSYTTLTGSECAPSMFSQRTQTLVVKKDQLWKPLFRRFRKFLKEFINMQTEPKLFSEKSVKKRGAIYGQLLNISPDVLATEKHLFALVLLIESRRMTCKRDILPAYKTMLQPHLMSIRHTYFDIFNENTISSREQFFKDRLLQQLWKFFSANCDHTLSGYFETIKRGKNGDLKSKSMY